MHNGDVSFVGDQTNAIHGDVERIFREERTNSYHNQIRASVGAEHINDEIVEAKPDEHHAGEHISDGEVEEQRERSCVQFRSPPYHRQSEAVTKQVEEGGDEQWSRHEHRWIA